MSNVISEIELTRPPERQRKKWNVQFTFLEYALYVQDDAVMSNVMRVQDDAKTLCNMSLKPQLRIARAVSVWERRQQPMVRVQNKRIGG